MKAREKECRAELTLLDNMSEEKPVCIQIKDDTGTAIIALTEQQLENMVDEIIFILGGRKKCT